MSQLQQSIQQKLGKSVRQALKDWHSTNQEKNALADLYLYRDVQQDERLLPREASNLVLKSGIDELRIAYGKDAELLEARFMDGTSIQNLSYRYNVAESTVYGMQKEAVDRLVNILDLHEQEASSAQKARLLQRLDAATYTNLVGVSPLIDKLLIQVTTPKPPWIISIEGMGGIGKTSLAHSAMSAVVAQGIYSEIGWVSARQHFLNFGGGIEAVQEPALTAESLVDKLIEQLMPEYAAAGLPAEQQLRMLQTCLKDEPHLIVVDNLETLIDVESLLPTLQKLSDPTRFILTSREKINSRINTFPYSVPELGRDDSLTLIRQEARLSNLPVLADAGDEELSPIYDVVGGNPLALRLVVGQHHAYALDEILDGLKKVASSAGKDLYGFVYKQAWSSLSEASQTVFKIMPLANPSGDDIDFLAEVSGLSDSAIRKELNHLVQLNLVDARGGLNERRYSIHGLTRTFLHEDVLGWMGSDDG